MSVFNRKGLLLSAATALLLNSMAFAQEATIEVLHYWTSGGESKAAKALQMQFEENKGKWIDSPVAGGGGDAQAAVLRSRVLAGDPPGAVQIKGPNIREWAEQDALENIDDVAKAENWDALLPPLIKDVVTYEGHYVAVPVNIHRVDWLWVNPKALEKAGVKMPTNWDEFNAAAEKIKAAGIVPLAHSGGAGWDAMTLEIVALGMGGADFYKKAFVELDDTTLRSDTMKKVYDQFGKLRGFVDPGYVGREWNLGTAMVMKGEAAMQIMGDWAKGEFSAAGLKPGSDYLCVPAFTNGGYDLNSDSFAFFKNSKGASNSEGKKLFAKLVLGESFQETFNLYKGSIPARIGVKRDKFDECAIRSMDDLDMAVKSNKLVPTMAHEMAVPRAIRGAMLDAITAFFNSKQSSDEGVKALADAVAAAK